MPHWNETIILADLVHRWKVGQLSIPDLAANVVNRIRKESGWHKLTPYPETLDAHLDILLAATDRDEYEGAFEELYDLADSDRVWIECS